MQALLAAQQNHRLIQSNLPSRLTEIAKQTFKWPIKTSCDWPSGPVLKLHTANPAPTVFCNFNDTAYYSIAQIKFMTRQPLPRIKSPEHALSKERVALLGVVDGHG